MFEKLNLRCLKNCFKKDRDISREQNAEFNLPLVNAKDGSNGIMYYGRSQDFESATMTIDIVNDGAISTGNVYSQPNLTGVLYNAYLIKPKFEVSPSVLHFFTSSIYKSIKPKFGYENKAGWEKVKKEKILLPVKLKKIDFDFMGSFIAELETERIAELEAYLSVTGLKDYVLTQEEKQVLDDFDNLKFDGFDIIKLFDVINTKSILSRDVVENSGVTPYLCASSESNAVSSYISFDQKYLDIGNCIFIGGKTFIVTYQENDFYSNDSHNLALYLKEDAKRNKYKQIYLATCIKKSLGYKYSWGNSISSAKIQTDKVFLPVCNDQPNYDVMDVFISAIQKLVIKNVVDYLDDKIEKTKSIVNSKVNMQ